MRGTKAETAHMDLKMLIERVKADDADALNTIYEALRGVCSDDEECVLQHHESRRGHGE